MACRVFHVDFSGFDDSDAKVTRCGWCPDFFHPDPAHHPNGQVEHVERPAASPDAPDASEGAAMTTTDLPTGFGRRNPHCANCGDERGGPFGHETSECRYRAGMTAGEVANIQPEERRREFWDVAIDRYLRSQGIDPD